MEQQNTQPKKLYRSKTNRIIFGVCGGLGEYFNIDPIIFRIIFIALTVGAGSGVILYIVLAFLMPNAPSQGTVSSDEINLKERANELVSELKNLGGNQSDKRNIFAILIIAVGIFLFLDEVLPFAVFNWSIFWSFVIVFFGVMILMGKKWNCGDRKREQSSSESIDASQPKGEMISKKHDCCHRRGIGIFRLFFGLMILIIGFALLAQNLNIFPGLNFDFSVLFKFWPIFIIFAGLSLLSQRSWIGSILSIIFAFVLIIVFIALLMSSGGSREANKSQFEIKKETGATRAELTLDTGASKVDIGGGAIELASGDLETNLTTLETESKIEDGLQMAAIRVNGSIRNFSGQVKSDLRIDLNNDIPLSLNMHSGASSLDFDASSLLLDELKLDAGASRVRIVFGDKVYDAKAEISAGASSIELVLPKNLGVRLEVDSALSGKQFADLKQVGDKYESENYSGAEKKIDIKINAGVSNISVVML